MAVYLVCMGISLQIVHTLPHLLLTTTFEVRAGIMSILKIRRLRLSGTLYCSFAALFTIMMKYIIAWLYAHHPFSLLVLAPWGPKPHLPHSPLTQTFFCPVHVLIIRSNTQMCFMDHSNSILWWSLPAELGWNYFWGCNQMKLRKGLWFIIEVCLRHESGKSQHMCCRVSSSELDFMNSIMKLTYYVASILIIPKCPVLNNQ